MKYIIGIDIGTTHTKAVVITTAGKVVHECKKGYPTNQPQPGFSEQDANDILAAVVQVIQESAALVSKQGDILCISFSAAMHSIMAVSGKGDPITPMITWADTRAAQYAATLQQSSLGNDIYRQTGTPIHPMSPLCKIAWLRDNEPEVFTAASKFISIKEYVLFRLYGVYVVDYSIASATGLFDYAQLTWSSAALAFCGISEERLSTPVATEYQLRAMQDEYKSKLGLPGETVCVMGGGDGGLANLGSGALLQGEAAVTIGTSGAVRIITNHPMVADSAQLFSYLLDEQTFFCGGAVNNGGNVMKWLETLLGLNDIQGKDITQLIQKAPEVAAGSDGLVFLPYLHGERAPVWDASARAVFIGITASHTQPHFIRAVLEGICFSLLQVLEAIERNGFPVQILYASGGFIESSFWVQLLADITQKKISVSRAADASALGAAFAGLRALGFIREWKEVKAFIHDGMIIHPSGDNQAYQRNYSVYAGLYKKLKDDFNTLAGNPSK